MAQQTEPNDARVRTERDMPGTRATRTTTERRMGDAESASTLLARAQAELARGRLRAAREQFFGAAQAADAERLPVIRAEAAIGAGGLWLHELRVTDERAAFLALVRDALAGLGGARPDLQRRLHIRLRPKLPTTAPARSPSWRRSSTRREMRTMRSRSPKGCHCCTMRC